MTYPFEIEKVPAFLGTKKITHLYQDQYDHIVNPVMEVAEKAFNGEVDSRMGRVFCPPGSGKTTVFNIDLIWRVTALAVKYNSRNNVILITAPDLTIVQDNYELLNEYYKDSEIYNYLLNEHGIDFRGLYKNPSDILGRGLEIVVCSIQKASGDQYPYLKKQELLMKANDESHRGLGCPLADEYLNDIGHHNSFYEAKWFNAMNELSSKLWFGLTSSETDSMRTNDKYYFNVSDKMEKSEWRLPFFSNNLTEYPAGFKDNQQMVVDFWKKLAKRNAINKYLHSKIPAEYLKTPILSKLNETKTTGMLKCGLTSSIYMEPDMAVTLMDKLNEEFKDKTFMYEGEELSYHIGSPAILTTAGGVVQKTGGSNIECIKRLNSEKSSYNSVSVIYIGAVGINITNCGIIAILPCVDNDGDVDNNLYQLFCRMDRNKYGSWRGEFDYEVSQISDEKIRDTIIKLAVSLATKEALISEGGMAKRAYNKTKENHVLAEDAYGYLHGLVSLKRQITNSTEQDEIYKLYKNKNPHCEVCEKNEDEIPMCEVTAKQNHLNMSDGEFNEYWFGCMDVDHEDGDHTNNDTENLFTKCKNEHQFKTMMKKDYLNRYDKSGKLI